jgi:hypothetical protein
MERLGHKSGYHMKDSSGMLATIVQASQKDNAAANDDTCHGEYGKGKVGHGDCPVDTDSAFSA